MKGRINSFLITLIILFFVGDLALGQDDTSNFKRGYGFGHHTQEDMKSLATGTSWWYNWWHRPDKANNILGSYQELGMEFVPQAWDGNFDEKGMREYLVSHPEVQYIMGFNEPNFLLQANMSPAEVASQWHRIESIADDFNLKIVGPALNYSPDAPYHSPFDWMDEWLKECEKIGGCRYDFVNVHCYMNNIPALEWYVNEWGKYNKPIWLTEFCAWDGIELDATVDFQKQFMIDALSLLDNHPNVFRYAWFTARSKGIPFNSLLTDKSGELTELGMIYTNQYSLSNKNVASKISFNVTKKQVNKFLEVTPYISPLDSAILWALIYKLPNQED